MRLAAILFVLAALSPAAEAQQWTHTGRRGPDRQVTLRETAPGEYSLYVSQGDNVCLRSAMAAKVARNRDAQVITAQPAVSGCETRRFTLPNDGNAGWEEVRVGERWVRSPGQLKGASAVAESRPAPLAASSAVSSAAPASARAPAPARAGASTAPAAAAKASQPASPRPLTARALVVGNGSYASFGELPNPSNDARALADKLRRMGIETELVLDAGREKFAEALSRFGVKSSSADVNLFFYAGHGVQVDGKNYLIPVDMESRNLSRATIELRAIPLDSAMRHLRAKTRIVFLDACRDNPVSRSLTRTRSAGGGGLAPVRLSAGTLIAYATKDGSTAEDGTGRHSPFTAALLQHIDKPQDIAVVLRQVRRSVMAQTKNRQEPWDYGSLIGDQIVVAHMRTQ
jgi:hypothetical protein